MRISRGGCAWQHFIFHHETTRFSREGCLWQYFEFSPRDHEIISWWMCMTTYYFWPWDHEIFSWWLFVTIFLIFTTRPRDFLVVGVGDNIFTTRPRDFLVVGDNIFTTRPRDFLGVGVGDNIFTMRPRDFLVVGLCDSIFIFFWDHVLPINDTHHLIWTYLYRLYLPLVCVDDQADIAWFTFQKVCIIYIVFIYSTR